MSSVLRLPSSPLKINVLQPSNKVNNANQQLLRLQNSPGNNSPCLPDSTDENSKKNNKRGKKARVSAASTTMTSTEVPLKKHHHSVKKPQTPSVSRRNLRERNRVKQVNNGFSTLRTHIPHLKSKTSKVDTLRAAVEYIKALRNLMGEPLKDDQLHRGPVLITDIEDNNK